MANYMYGTGPDVLWRHANVDPDVHAWMGRELGFAPFRGLLRQLVKSTGKRHIVPAEKLPGMPDSYVDGAPGTDARFTFVVGDENRMFLPAGPEGELRALRRARARPPRVPRLRGDGSPRRVPRPGCGANGRSR